MYIPDGRNKMCIGYCKHAHLTVSSQEDETKHPGVIFKKNMNESVKHQ